MTFIDAGVVIGDEVKSDVIQISFHLFPLRYHTILRHSAESSVRPGLGGLIWVMSKRCVGGIAKRGNEGRRAVLQLRIRHHPSYLLLGAV